MVFIHPSIKFAQCFPVSRSGQVASIKLDFDKSLKELYDLGHLTVHGLSEGQVRLGHKNLQASLCIYLLYF